MNISWPPGRVELLDEVLAFHKSSVSPFYSIHPDFKSPSVDVGCDTRSVKFNPPNNSDVSLYVAEIDGGIFFRGTDCVLEPESLRLLSHDSTDYVHALNKWGGLYNNLPSSHIADLDGTTLLVGGGFSQYFYHFLLDVVVGRIAMTEQFGYSFSEIDRVVVSNSANDYAKSWFDLLGISSKVVVAPNCFIRCEKLLAPSIPYGHPPSILSYIRNRACRNKTLPNRKLYVSRGNGASNGRRLINELEIYERLLKPNGFEFIGMDGLSLNEQADTFSSASFICAPNGAALTNLVFSRKDTKVLELFGGNYINPAIYYLCDRLDIKHYHAIGLNASQHEFSDYSIDLEHIDIDKYLFD